MRARPPALGLNINFLPVGRVEVLAPLLHRLAALGTSHVELVARRLGLVVAGRVDEARLAAVWRSLQDCALTPVLHANHAVNLMVEDGAAAHEAAAVAAIAAAARLGAGIVVLHSGRLAGGVAAAPDRLARALERERAALSRLAHLAGEQGVVVALENMIARPWTGILSYGARPRALAGQIAAVAHPALGACLDVGHAHLSAATLGFDMHAEIGALAPLVRHIHVHDNCGRADRLSTGDAGDDIALGIGDMHAPLGDGTVDWTGVAQALAAAPACTIIHELAARFEGRAGPAVEAARAWAGRVVAARDAGLSPLRSRAGSR